MFDILFIITKEPKSNQELSNIQNQILSSTIFFSNIAVLFMNKGIYHLSQEYIQKYSKLQSYKAFNLYQIENIYIDINSLKTSEFNRSDIFLDDFYNMFMTKNETINLFKDSKKKITF